MAHWQPAGMAALEVPAFTILYQNAMSLVEVQAF